MGTRRSKEDDWTEVTRKNRGYRTKEDDLVKVHSNADLTRTISKSIFVTNFPDNTTSADLWNICQTYGVVVDVYIPNRRSKVGKRFAFVRFIKQSQPPPPTRPGKIAPSFVSAVKGILPTPVLSPPAMVLDDSCMVTTDLRNYVMGEVKLFSSVNNLRVILSAEGFSIQKVVYLGGLWVMFELPSANSKSKFLAHVGVGSWFKSLSNPQPDFSSRDRIIWVDVEGAYKGVLALETNRYDNILEKFKIIVKGNSFVVRAKELFVWSPSFVEVTKADDIHEEGEFIQIGEEGLEKHIHQTNVKEESDIEAVSETFFGDQADDLNEVVDSAQQSIPKENSYDPFNIYDILNKENKDVNAAATNSSIPFPPGFTPDKPDTDVDELVAQKDQFQPDVKSVGSSSHTVESANNVDDQFSTGSIENIQKKKESGSILEILEEMISVGQTMGFSMEGSIKDMERIIDLKGADDHETKAEKVSDMEIKSLWGNTNFDAIVSQSLANQTRMLIVSVYAPQSVSLKRTLWSYLSSLINRWNGECIVLGDFNEVRRKEERWGSIFNVYGARDFNHFITSAGLVEVQLEGYSYTWAHPSASKMSKLDRFLVSDGFLSLFPHTSAVCLDRHLSDHRPILLREFNTDYGATPFRLFHSWFDFQGFDDMITQTWNSINLNDSNAMVRFKKKLQALKKVIRLWIGNYKRNQMNRTTEIKIKLKDIDKLLDQLGANDDLLSVRSELLKQYHDIHSVETRESIQKAKIKWAVEGDENSKFFHGMINRKRANLAVKGVMIDGEWVDDPSKVKDEFRDYFASRFCDPGIRHGVINFNFPNRLNIDQSGELEAPISRDEIRRAVWDCGENKSPGPDGFTFEFFRKFWNIVGPDLCLAVEWFFHHASFPVGCNSSFIALIPKTLNPKSVGEYRPISLIGSIYKIVTKILANRLSTVIADIISNVQTTFLPNRQILDGPFIINELLARCHYKNHSAKGIKIDSSTTLSHLFYADDAVFIGEWSSRGNLNWSPNAVLNSRNLFGGIFSMVFVMARKRLLGLAGLRWGQAESPYKVSPISLSYLLEALEILDHLLFCCHLAKDIARFNQVQNRCWKECFTLPGGVSGHIETISSSLIQIFEKMVFLKT
ncbi:RNA-directed DNA polymerase, eukaryota [Tanacetum coccineum]|uniref:RNA-directed DNA polymerase, eukaryota n=1 Tax=Tanacetum coccineum TaxID=301880 RepID=A0ABQ4Z5P0_9ASTR